METWDSLSLTDLANKIHEAQLKYSTVFCLIFSYGDVGVWRKD